jgi:hypothetical protein
MALSTSDFSTDGFLVVRNAGRPTSCVRASTSLRGNYAREASILAIPERGLRPSSVFRAQRALRSPPRARHLRSGRCTTRFSDLTVGFDERVWEEAFQCASPVCKIRGMRAGILTAATMWMASGG